MRLFNLFNFEECQEPCEDIVSPMGIEPCYVLHRVDACTWEGTADTHATCFPLSTLRLELGCDESTTTLRLYWLLSATDVAIWEKTVQSPTINCGQCGTHELEPIQQANGCGTQASWAHINFGAFNGCCEHCPDQYQITIAGTAENDVEENCEDADCQQLNGVYLLDFVGRNRTPSGACTDGFADWCEYSTDLDLRCTDNRFGFCSLHLFVKTTSQCGTKIRVELKADVHETLSCETGPNVRQGWQKT